MSHKLLLARFRRWQHTTCLFRLAAIAATLAIGVGRDESAASDQPVGEDGLTVWHSTGGVLNVTLVARDGVVDLDGIRLAGITYNGDYAGPVLHVLPGDLLRATLVNRLDQPTNLHFHGMRTSPLGLSDNVHIAVQPGASLTYEVHIPKTQPPGLYWYHAHPHGASEHQVMGGLSGALVVDRPKADATPDGITQKLFVLKDMTFDDDIGIPEVDDDLHGIVLSANGHRDVTPTMRPGETQLWGFTNQSANRPLFVGLEGHRFRIVAEDGADNVTETSSDVLTIMPAARVEALVEGGSAGRYAITARRVLTGNGVNLSADRVLGHLLVAGEPSGVTRPSSPDLPPDLRSAAITARRSVVFSQTTDSSMDRQQFFINGKLFDPARVDTRVPLGSTEEWTIRNDSDDMHVFHIHQVGFQVTEVNGSRVAFNGWVDTVRVPERGEVKLRIAFTDPAILGRFMYHCHVLHHEDGGMMAQIEVYRPDPPGLQDRLRSISLHVWWWMHGVPWSQCGIAST